MMPLRYVGLITLAPLRIRSHIISAVWLQERKNLFIKVSTHQAKTPLPAYLMCFQHTPKLLKPYFCTLNKQTPSLFCLFIRFPISTGGINRFFPLYELRFHWVLEWFDENNLLIFALPSQRHAHTHTHILRTLIWDVVHECAGKPKKKKTQREVALIKEFMSLPVGLEHCSQNRHKSIVHTSVGMWLNSPIPLTSPSPNGDIYKCTHVHSAPKYCI